MAVSGEQFWTLLGESGLLKEAEVAHVRKAADPQLQTGPALASWLVSQSKLSPFQGQVLASGSSGPFRYGDFLLESRVEHPGLQTLFTAKHVADGHSPGHPVWLDFLSPIPGESDVAVARRVEIAQQHCLIRQPELTDCYLFEQLPEFKFLVLESPQGKPLDQHIAEHGPVKPAEAVTWIRQLASGLEALHAKGLGHGRVHPANIMIDDQAARLIRNPMRHALPLKSPAIGHMPDWTMPYAYATPELSAWDRWPDTSGDIYGLGCVLHFLLTGQPPFDGTTSREIVRQHMNEAPNSVASIAGEPLDQIMQKLLGKTAQSRMQSLSELNQALTSNVPNSTTPDLPARKESASFPAFFQSMQSRQTAVEEEVAQRAADPDFANRTNENLRPNVESESLLESRILDAEGRGKGLRWLVPVLSIGMAALLFHFGKVVFEPLEPLASTETEEANALGNPDEPDPNTSTGAANALATLEPNSTADPLPEARRFEIANDDGQLLWAPLTDGQPHTFTYGQQGGQLFFALRPADLFAHPEGQRVVQALGPDFEKIRARWEKKHKVNLDSVEQLIVVVSADIANRPVSVSDILLKPGQKLPEEWIGDDLANTPSGPMFTSGTLACLVPSGTEQRHFVIGPTELVTEIGQRGNQPPALRRELKSLCAYSDSNSLFTLMLSPSYLLRDGRNLVAPAYASLPQKMDTFFGDGINGLLFTAHLNNTAAFGELRLATTLEVQKPLQNELPKKFSDLSSLVESYVSNLQRMDDYWKPIALRYHNMIQFLSQQTRVDIEDRQLVMNAHLPATAAHNLVLATELALAAGVSDTPVAKISANPIKELPTLAHVLIQKTSLNIPQQSLEFSMRDLAEDVNENIPGLPFPFKIEISGVDLQLDGITRNQQIRDFRGENQRICDLLTGLVMRANPITTVKKPNEPDQKLVWVINRPKGGELPPHVLITTRKAAQTKGYSLPKFFRME